MRAFIIKIDAKNCHYGNPRRAFLVYDREGRLLEVIDEGYGGDQEVREKYPHYIHLATIPTTPRFYRDALKGE